MSPAQWVASNLDPEDGNGSGRPQPALVSLHFIRAALRRRRRALVLAVLLGLVLAGAYLVMVPPARQATVTMALAHDQQADPERAMATDLSLATTRAVAQRVITTLRLSETPEDLLKRVIATPATSDILTVTLAAPTQGDAVRQLRAFTTAYLEFRSAQLSAQSNLLIKGMNRRVDALQQQVNDLTTTIEGLTTSTSNSAAGELSDAITRRAKVGSQIDVLQQSIQDTNLRTTAIVAGSRVIDPPAAVPRAEKRRIALALASGLIGGGSTGVGLILFAAITSSRVRRRADVVTALGVPVLVSVGRPAPLPGLLRRLPGLRRRDRRREADRQRLARAIESLVPPAGRGGGLVVGSVDSATDVRFGLVAAALAVQVRGTTVRLVDLTAEGGLAAALESLLPAESLLPDQDGIRVTVSRPRSVPSLAMDMSDLDTLGPASGPSWAWGPSDLYLVLTDLVPSEGVDYLRTWSRRVLVAVTAGKSSAERLRTAGELVRSAGLELAGAVLIRTDRSDDSAGTVGTVGTAGTAGATVDGTVKDQW